MQRFFIIAGIVLLAIGFGWRWIARIPFGRLPGDIDITRDGFHFMFPITTCILISAVATILFWIFKRW